MSSYIRLLRPRQLIKNVVVFAPIVFSAHFFILADIHRTLIAFLALCLFSSALYIANDVRDRIEDTSHPTKKHRPVASGAVSVRNALILMTGLVACATACALVLGLLTFVAASIFVGINVAYTLGGKRVAILDVMLIGASFVARVLVGAAAILVPVSAWLFLTLFFLATYLGFTKRTAELRLGTTESRKALEGYTSRFLEHARSATLAVTLALYTLYTFASPYGQVMALTVPFVFFGLLRYQAIVDVDDGENDGPSDHVYMDRQLQIAVMCWCVCVLVVIVMSHV